MTISKNCYGTRCENNHTSKIAARIWDSFSYAEVTRIEKVQKGAVKNNVWRPLATEPPQSLESSDQSKTLVPNPGNKVTS